MPIAITWLGLMSLWLNGLLIAGLSLDLLLGLQHIVCYS